MMDIMEIQKYKTVVCNALWKLLNVLQRATTLRNLQLIYIPVEKIANVTSLDN